MALQPTLRIGTGRWIFAIVLVALSVYVQRDGWSDLAGIALKDEESSHILLVPIVAAWLIWVRRDRLRSIRGEFSYVGAAITAAGAFLSYWGVGHGTQFYWHAGTVLMAIGCAITALGTDVILAFFPVLLVLGFLIPVPATVRIAMSIPLERITAQVVQLTMEVVGITVNRSGNLLSVNGVDVTVAEACNGLRMVFGLILVTAAFVFGTPMRWYVRALLLVLSPVLAMMLNVVRLVPTVLIFGHASHETAEMFHDASGWCMLPLAFVLLLGVQKLLKWMCVPIMPYRVVYA